MSKFCQGCGSSAFNEIEQTFRDGTKHTRLECTECQTFCGYKKRHNGFDKLLFKGDASDMSPNDILHQLDEMDVSGRFITIIAKVR